MIDITLYSRAGCHLCEDVIEMLAELQSIVPHNLSVVDIESDPQLQKTYLEKIPVVITGPYRLMAPIDRQQLEVTLRAAADRLRHIDRAEQAAAEVRAERESRVTSIDQFAFWLSKHYLAVFNLFVLIYLGLPFLAPVLMKYQVDAPAALIYRAYGAMCHQMAFRSIFLFGEQAIYPRASAGMDGFVTYEQATGLDPLDQFAARDFIGNEQLGFKVALCQRDVAIYGGILLFGVVFGLVGRRIKPLPWYAWIILGMAPMGLDGVSQLISQLPFEAIQNLLPYRESTLQLRLLTGSLFGITTAWFGYPAAEIAMSDTRRIMEARFSRAAARQAAESNGTKVN